MKSKLNLIVGVTGGVAAYKAAQLVSLCKKDGFEVKVIMTKTAEEFIKPLTFESILNDTVYRYNSVDVDQPMLHIDLARWADLILVAPATAEIISKIAHGRANDLLSTTILASNSLLAVAPSMNKNMWENKITQENINVLNKNKIAILGPDHGRQACGDVGYGRMLEPEQIFYAVQELLSKKEGLFKGKKVIITAGATKEMIDPIRFISNESSGQMGCEIADAFHEQGAEVILIKGVSKFSTRNNLCEIEATSAEQMLRSIENNIDGSDIFISTAAVVDFIPESKEKNKIKKEHQDKIQIDFKKNIDILKTISNKYSLFTIGFAAETENLEKNAMKKLISKNLNIIAANKVGENLGIDSDENEIILFWGKNNNLKLEKKKKQFLAIEFVEKIFNIMKSEAC